MTFPPISPDKPWLAPLAGYSDLPFRMLCREYGAACAVTEMVSAKGMVHYSPGTKDLLATDSGDSPLVVQLFGCEPEMFERAMDMLLEKGFSLFDLNCGCSVPKVVKTGSGAALLRTPDTLRRIVDVMVAKAGPGRVGVKLRTGWSADETPVFDIASSLEDLGAAWFTLHPRHARQGYSGTARWEHIAGLKRRSRIPVMASGDLFTAADARRCLAETGADGVMFARGAMYDPAIFKHYLNNSASQASGPEVAGMIARHAEFIRRYGRPERALLRMRSIVPRYVRNLLGARSLRQEVASCSSWEHLAEITGRIALADPAPERERQRANGGDDGNP
ncbi:MAG: tRNA dihydrouridine synthase [Thermodesulfobacteriota bacterium]